MWSFTTAVYLQEAVKLSLVEKRRINHGEKPIILDFREKRDRQRLSGRGGKKVRR